MQEELPKELPKSLELAPGWLKYPENKPPSKNPTWYIVKLDDGTETQACAWFDDWYCFNYWDRVVGFLPNPILD